MIHFDEPEKFTVIQSFDRVGGTYPYFTNFTPDWTIESGELEGTFFSNGQTLTMLKDGKQTRIHISGIEDDVRLIGIETNNDKPFSTRAKRLKRAIGGPFPYTLWLNQGELNIRYLDQTPEEMALWDGAGLISREFLLRMIVSDNLTDRRQKELKRELSTVDRVEFTIMTTRGQDKGHAYVIDSLEADFVLPRDTKTEIKHLPHMQDMIAIRPFHGKDETWMDIQSLINLFPFFGLDNIIKWTREYSDDFLNQIANDEREILAYKVGSENWSIIEYFASGGSTMWFPAVVRAVGGQYIAKLENKAEKEFRFPIPGGRYYVFCEAIRQPKPEARKLKQGQILIEGSTVWVSAEDYVQMMSILGGGDQDDAVMTVPYTNANGEQMVLLWRQPNEVGEYWKATLHPDSQIPEWVDGSTFPRLYEEHLPTRIDQRETRYLGLIPRDGTPIGVGMEYTNANILEHAMEREIKNRGGLGQYINWFMVWVAMGKSLAELPDRTENIIDAMVKTGDDLSQVRAWVMAKGLGMIANSRKEPIPGVLLERVPGARKAIENGAIIHTTKDHWTDVLYRFINKHIKEFRERLNELSLTANPPAEFFEHMPSDMTEGILMVQAYNNIISQAYKRAPHFEPQTEDFELANKVVQEFLDGCEDPQETVTQALYWTRFSVKGDSACWIRGITDQYTIEHLRDIGILDDIMIENDRAVKYPRASVSEKTCQVIEIGYVWYNLAKHTTNPDAQRPSDVPKTDADNAKERVSTINWVSDIEITTDDDGKQYAKRASTGNQLGVVKSNVPIPDGRMHIGRYVVRKGDIIAVVNAS